MSGGYIGKILFVDLSKREIKEEVLKEKLCHDFLGGYRIGARILYSRQKPGVDPIGPENTLGFVAGPLTGTPTPTGARYMVVGKSPLTGGWGDANSGGYFGPYLKFAGFDAVFFTGISPNPAYLLIDNGNANIKDASHLWSKDTYETEDTLMQEYGKQSRVACIGPSGEKLCLIAGIMTDYGSAAACSGLGAVMGSKRLKAIVARGTMEIPLANKVLDEAEAIGMIRYAIDHGVNYLDSGFTYHKGNCEILISKALKDGYREKVRVATKLWCPDVNSPDDFDLVLNEQLRRLQTQKIDFYLLHHLNKINWP